ncbi:hypothetical protein VTN77DRAFT_1692 [Rasamsonia byssochlamydoides]|uniref:uncharacterized protein n=1 Tax=Rasamsonia byssochlamydoides TaxID=89139 RepID=UPI0037423745
MLWLLWSLLAFLLFLGQIVLADFDLLEDDDLTTFVTRPEIKAPKFDVVVHDPSRVSPGYWFVAPYANIEPDPPTKKYTPCQVGPHIYDADGTLVWAGSCDYENQNIFDFKVVDNIDDQAHLSFIIEHAYQNEGGRRGGGQILNSHYEYENWVPVTNDLGAFDIHEFNILDGGKTALVTTYRPEFLDLSDLGRPMEQGWVMTGGFEELDVATGRVIFEWRSLPHIPLGESTSLPPSTPIADPPGWDYLHVNSVDKNADGDYLLSARFTDTIYLISGVDGHIIWRLGGHQSDFVLENFRFYRQHNARFLESNSTHITISFLDNASDEISQNEPRSSALVVVLNIAASPMTATAIKRYNRPDGGLSRLRGNAQILPNGNMFVGWSDQGYHSEFTDDGTCVMEARFSSDRFSTYRSYKFDFHGRPRTPPDLKAFVYGSPSSNTTTTVFYVSWNGATDVASWNFYARATAGGPPVLIGNAPKTGFETMFVSDGYMNWVSVEALDADGTSLGMSKIHNTTVPDDWLAAGFEKLPVPQDPATVVGGNDDDATEAEDVEKQAAAAAALAYDFLSGIGGLLILTLVVTSIGVLAGAAICALRVHRRQSRYHEIPSEETETEGPPLTATQTLSQPTR